MINISSCLGIKRPKQMHLFFCVFWLHVIQSVFCLQLCTEAWVWPAWMVQWTPSGCFSPNGRPTSVTIKHTPISPRDPFPVKQQYFTRDCNRSLFSVFFFFFPSSPSVAPLTLFQPRPGVNEPPPPNPSSAWTQIAGRNPLAIAGDWLFAQLRDNR